MSLDCGRKPEYQVRTHACTGRTCKLHAERPQAGNRTQDLLAARQQCHQLHQHAAYDEMYLFFYAVAGETSTDRMIVYVYCIAVWGIKCNVTQPPVRQHTDVSR
ncbi:hypothetical protein ILYODFUR_032977 [Ilyodon furcidens]|uniref:Uncharacterized protein n=1 Tax=Ilyodon furcidens TaxID=33524 RepID=A0ABV0VJ34_9TELE